MPPAPETDPLPRLGYLLKHANLRYAELTGAALAPLGIDTREWVTLMYLDSQPQLSQAEAAKRLGIDRTTMVAVIDQLERKGLVARRPHPDDRRKNAVEVTPAGRDLRERADRQIDECERRFLAGLGQAEARQLKRALHAVIGPVL
jgi:DNA-binding MarR family transcriptional regulator